jgi:hypothetical protein
MSMNEDRLVLNFYGLEMSVGSQDSNTLSSIRRDFKYFEKAADTSMLARTDVRIFEEKPDYAVLPKIPASIYALDYVVFKNEKITYTDFHNRGLRIYDSARRHYDIFSEDGDLRHEITYLTILAVVGRYLDAQHLHRVHALGVSKNGQAILVLLPEKGGKTTLALRLIKCDGIKLLSEDSPLISRQGEVLPFPLRMGILPGGENGIPPQYLYRAKFLRVGVKLMVDLPYFADKISPPSRPGIILIGERVLNNDAAIIPIRKYKALKELVKNSVIGLGLHQGMEYLLGSNIFETIGKSRLACSRLNNSLKLLHKSKVYRYQIGHDMEHNINVLLDFLNK